MNLKENTIWRLLNFILLIVGFACFLLGIIQPMVTVKKLVLIKNTFSVMGGIKELLTDKTIGLGLLLLLFSVIFPIVKFLMMGIYLIIYPQPNSILAIWQGWFGKISKFSMLDVFIVGQMLMILKLGWLVEVQIHNGIYWFTAAVLLSLCMGITIDSNISKRMQVYD